MSIPLNRIDEYGPPKFSFLDDWYYKPLEKYNDEMTGWVDKASRLVFNVSREPMYLRYKNRDGNVIEIQGILDDVTVDHKDTVQFSNSACRVAAFYFRKDSVRNLRTGNNHVFVKSERVSLGRDEYIRAILLDGPESGLSYFSNVTGQIEAMGTLSAYKSKLPNRT